MPDFEFGPFVFFAPQVAPAQPVVQQNHPPIATIPAKDNTEDSNPSQKPAAR